MFIEIYIKNYKIIKELKKYSSNIPRIYVGLEEIIYPLGSLALYLKPLYPHLRQVFAVGGFRALHLRQILILNILFSASSNLAII
jgi:hypothetical protein